MIETSQLQTLVSVAKAGSFSKAAEDLGVTQSAISQSVKNLEKKIETKLFKRSGKQVLLTQEGEKLFDLATSFIAELNDTLDQIDKQKDSMAGKVRIGTLTGVGKSWLAPELLDFSKEHEQLTLSITLGFREDIVRDFENFRLDMLILPETELPASGERVLLGEEKSVLVYPKTSLFDDIGEDLSLDQLASYPTILFEGEDTLFLKWCRLKFGRTPKKINTRYVVNSHGNMLQAVTQGLGIAVVPNHVFNRSYYRTKVRTLGEDSQVSNGKFYILYHKEGGDLVRIQKTLERLTSQSDPFHSESDDVH